MKKRICILLSIVVLITGVFVATAFTSGAASPEPELEISYCNLSFRDSIAIKYAVKTNASDVKILIWTSPEEEYTVGTNDDEITEWYTDAELGSTYKVFDYTKLTAKQMTDVIYARAYTRVNGEDCYSEVNKYSVLQYAYNKLGKTAAATEDAELKETLTNMLAYGASAQKYLDDYKVDRLATADWYQVVLTAGKLDDGCTHGLYLPEDKVTMIADATDERGESFSYWKDSKGNRVATTASYELTVGNANEVYTPVYGDNTPEIVYSEGLEFESNGDGTCIIIGIGDCTDTDIVIPPVSPDGDTVTEIDASVFAGEPITSVYFPKTIEAIGRRAFNNCTALTDVYYDGTEEEWNEISIGTYNDPIENAIKHFKEPSVESFTVTFVDYNGAILKTEAVESGKSATAPTAPTREGYAFVGWDKDYTNIIADVTVTAQYEIFYTEPTFVVDSVNAQAGDTVTVAVRVKANPGIASIKLLTEYVDGLTLTSIEYNTAIGGMSQLPQTYDSPAVLNWFNGAADSEGDFTFAVLTFAVSDEAVAGDYGISVTYNPNDVYDISETNIDFSVVNGKVTVS